MGPLEFKSTDEIRAWLKANRQKSKDDDYYFADDIEDFWDAVLAYFNKQMNTIAHQELDD